MALPGQTGTEPRGRSEGRIARPRIHSDIDSAWVTEPESREKAKSSTLPHLHTASIMAQTMHGWLDEVLNLRTVGRAQGLCYFGLGLWPLTHLSSLQAMTTPQAEAWVMQALGALLSVVGIILLLSSLRHRRLRTMTTLGFGIAGGLSLLVLAGVAAGPLPRIYLWDAALEVAFAGWWMAAIWRTRQARTNTQDTAADPSKLSNVAARARMH